VSPDGQARPGGPGHHLPRHRMSSRGRATVAAVLFLFLMLPQRPASAEPCSLTDPACLTDAVEETVRSVAKTVGSAEKTVNRTAEDVAETVDESGTEVVGQVGKVVDGLLGKGKDPGGGGGQDRPRAGRPGAKGGRGGKAVVTRHPEPRDPSLNLVFLTQAAVSAEGVRTPSEAAGAGGAIGTVARQLVFPAILAGMVLAFLAIQNRLDRRDPRLAAAPLGPEFLTFE
jgi:hypothetical protein